MTDRGQEQVGVVLVDAGDGVAEVNRDAVGEAGREQEAPLLASRAGQFSGCQRGGRGVPVDCGHVGVAAGAVEDEAAGEVAAAEERAVRDEEPDAGFERVEAGGAGAQRGGPGRPWSWSLLACGDGLGGAGGEAADVAGPGGDCLTAEAGDLVVLSGKP